MDLVSLAMSHYAFTVFISTTACIGLSVFWTILKQVYLNNPNEPPLVRYWVPVFGNAVGYGMDPHGFFAKCQRKYGDIFTFMLLGRKTTVYLGPKGNNFILNGKLEDVNAEEIYNVLTAPVFGKDVVYDCPNAKLMEQKKFIKYGLSSEALQTYVPLMETEIRNYLKRRTEFASASGTIEITKMMAEITIFTASRSLQGKEIRQKLDSSFAGLYHALDDGFQPINFMLPWAPLPQNRKRDVAQKRMTQIYTDIIRQRRKSPMERNSHDMLWNLMDSVYKDGTPVPEHEIAGMMIALLMAGQHSSSVTSSWIMLRMASRPDIMEELYQEQLGILGDPTKPLTLENVQSLPLLMNVVRETLRLHPPIHSIMRKVKNPLPVEGTNFVIPPSHVVLAAPGYQSIQAQYFPDPETWDPHRWEHLAEPVEDETDKMDYGYGLVSTGATSTYLPFGAGRHRCIGEQFAYMQITTIITTMVRMLKLENMEGTKDVPKTDYSSLFSRPMAPAYVRFQKRSNDG